MVNLAARLSFRTVVLFIYCAAAGVTADAAAPMLKTQAPGFYRMMLGHFEVTALNDGVVTNPVIFPGMTSEEINARLEEQYLHSPLEMSWNAFLINTGSKLILIDTGTGELAERLRFQGAGHLIENLRAAGYRPEQVDEVYITHAHPDHVGGLMLGGQRTFRNAILRAAQNELDRFFDAAKTGAAIASAKDANKAREGIQMIKGLFEPYMKAGRFRSFDGDITLVPGIRALATHGHTPGHTCYVVESRGETLIVLGDLVHHAAVQFANPWFPAASDWDPGAATSQRTRVFELAAAQGYWIAAAHISFPGLGHIRKDRGAYLWIPATYEIPK